MFSDDYSTQQLFTVVGDSLEYFYHRDEFLNEYIFCNSSAHDYAEIEFSCDSVERFKLLAYRLHKVLRGLSSVKHLTLSPFDAFKVHCLLFYWLVAIVNLVCRGFL